MLFSFYFFILNNRDYTYRKNETEDMFKKITSLFIICCLCIFVTACGPSEEKVAQAQQKYAHGSLTVEYEKKCVKALKKGFFFC